MTVPERTRPLSSIASLIQTAPITRVDRTSRRLVRRRSTFTVGSSYADQRTDFVQFLQLFRSRPFRAASQSPRVRGLYPPHPHPGAGHPQVLTGRDLFGIAQTGTGKTAAFMLPILDRLAKSPRPLLRKSCRMLVLSPTRELATQIADSFRAYGRHMRLSTAVVFGGTSVGKNERQVARRRRHPGRHARPPARPRRPARAEPARGRDPRPRRGRPDARPRLHPRAQADREAPARQAPEPVLLGHHAEGDRSSPTSSSTDPAKVAVTPVATTVERVEQRVIFVPAAQKQALLAMVLRDPAIERVLVFTRTKHGADKVVRGLDREGIAAAAIHGNKSQPQRERALAAFRAGKSRVLVATDIAARGIDVDGVSHVINFELPNVPEAICPPHRPHRARRRRRGRPVVLHRGGARLSPRHRAADAPQGSGRADARRDRRPCAGRGGGAPLGAGAAPSRGRPQPASARQSGSAARRRGRQRPGPAPQALARGGGPSGCRSVSRIARPRLVQPRLVQPRPPARLVQSRLAELHRELRAGAPLASGGARRAQALDDDAF